MRLTAVKRSNGPRVPHAEAEEDEGPNFKTILDDASGFVRRAAMCERPGTSRLFSITARLCIATSAAVFSSKILTHMLCDRDFYDSIRDFPSIDRLCIPQEIKNATIQHLHIW